MNSYKSNLYEELDFLERRNNCFVYDNCVYTQEKEKPEDCSCYTIYSSGKVAGTGFCITQTEFEQKKELRERQGNRTK